MEVNQTTLGPQLPASSGPTQVVQAWAVGQLLRASVVSHPRPGTVTLAIEGSQLQAYTQHLLRPGQALTLRVESLGQQPVLSLVDAAASLPRRELHWLRVALPRQNALSPLLTRLGEMGSGVSRELATLPDSVVATAARLVATLPTVRTLTSARGIARAAWESGFLLEAKLAQTPPTAVADSFAQDLKAGLLRVLAMLTRAGNGSTGQLPSGPPLGSSPLLNQSHLPLINNADQSTVISKLAGEVEGAVLRIQANQLRSLALAEQVSPVWYFELPVRERRGVSLVSLRIGRDRANTQKSEEGSWTVNLALDLGELGRVSARIALCAGAVSSNLWAEQASTAELFASHLDDLRDALTGAGLSVGAICCQAGEASADPVPEAYPSLLDVQA